MNSSRAIASIVNSFVQAIVYGIYITTLVHCLRWLVYNDEGWSRREKMNIAMLIISVALFLLQTAGLGTAFKTTLVLQNSDNKGFDLINMINSAAEYTTLQIVDAVLIYRCWVVHAYAWPIVYLPFLFWISSVALSSYDLYLYSLALSTTNPDAANRLSTLTLQIWDGFFACNIAINIYATTAIVYRIVRVTRNSANRSGRLHQTWRIIAESGALYTLSTIINLVATVLVGQNNSFEIFQVIADPINFSMAGIAFNLILIRVGQQRQQGATGQGKTSDSQFVSNKRGQPLSTIRFRGTNAADSTSSQNPSTLHSITDYQHV